MRVYVYGCTNTSHPRCEIMHEIGEDPIISCPECGERMHRIPQPLMGFYQNPEDTLMEWMDDNYRRKRSGRPLHSPYLVKRPYNPIPQTQFHARRKNESKNK